MSKKLVLLGDSIFDNQIYVTGVGPSVTEWLVNKMEGTGCEVENHAIDGDIIDGVFNQIASIPEDATHLALSVGGNDGLHYLGELMNRRCLLCNLIPAIINFGSFIRSKYSRLLDALQEDGRPLMLCTIYHPHFDHPLMSIIARIGINIAAGVILSEGKRRGLPVIDLRKVFTQVRDYANPIEPGVPGGDKLSENLIHVLNSHDFAAGRHRVYHSTDYSVPELSDWKVNESRYFPENCWSERANGWQRPMKRIQTAQKKLKGGKKKGLRDKAENDPFRGANQAQALRQRNREGSF
uniref:SGNH hydrolase-type esterase domain-containing protein n=1 Tax=Heterosigma akashiwo TaxID=2829 RepID=A0A7S3UYP9_HETAK|mmetsp:Transcript_7275/g.12803  ORF Transcript_7275/g.12803 Transcript_7275/m.12803 type:complete len:295 (+) Transcript_7275:52-936(+)